MNKWITWVLMFIMIASTTILASVTFIQVISRYVFSLSIPWSSDITRLSFAYAVFSGAAYASIDETGHLCIDLIPSLLKPKVRYLLQSLIYLILVVFMVFLTVTGVEYAMTSGMSQRMPYWDMPMTYMFFSVPISTTIIAYFYAQHCFHAVMKFLGKESHGEDKKEEVA